MFGEPSDDQKVRRGRSVTTRMGQNADGRVLGVGRSERHGTGRGWWGDWSFPFQSHEARLFLVWSQSEWLKWHAVGLHQNFHW